MRERGLRPTRDEAVAALASALLFALAFPPLPPVAAALGCLVPAAVLVARAADRGAGARTAARLGFWFALLGYGATLHWLATALSLFTRLAIVGYAATVVALGVIVAGVLAALHAARRATRWPLAILLPVVWTAGETALAHLGDLAFPWLPLGLATTGVPAFAQGAELSGVRGVTLWIALVNGLLADAWLARAARPAAARRVTAAAAVVVAAGALGAWRMRAVALRPLVTVAVVQPNAPQDDAWQAAFGPGVIDTLGRLTRVALRTHPRLVVWPETALLGFLGEHPRWRDSLRALTTSSRTPILTGVLDADADGAYYNAAVLATADGRVAAPASRKRRLVPVVERVPFLEPRWFQAMGPLSRWFGGYGRGRAAVVFDVPPARLGVLICYESIFPELAREYRRLGADVIVTITNDAWFGRSVAPWQHHAHLVLRAIETRAGVVRSANTGVSDYIDPLGRAHGGTALFVPAARTYRVETTTIRTPYVRFGDWAGASSSFATVLLVLADAWRARRARTRGRTA